MMNKPIFFLAIICFSFWGECIASPSIYEQTQLRNIGIALFEYMEDHNGSLPQNIEPLGGYIDVARLLGANPGSSAPFTESYAILPEKPLLELPSHGQVELILLATTSTDGLRSAIWINKNNLPEIARIREADLVAASRGSFKLESIRPMGGVVPITSEKVLAVARNSGMTDYQAKVLALVREGKIPLDTPSPSPCPSLPHASTHTLTSLDSSPIKNVSSPSSKMTIMVEGVPFGLPMAWLVILAVLGIAGMVVLWIRRG